MATPRVEKQSPAIHRVEDDQALALAEQTGFVVRRTMRHFAHRIYTRRCREQGLPCICVYLRRAVADVTLEMPGSRPGWLLSPEHQRATAELIQRSGCAAYNVGPSRVVACRMPVELATQLAQRLADLVRAGSPAGEDASGQSTG